MYKRSIKSYVLSIKESVKKGKCSVLSSYATAVKLAS